MINRLLLLILSFWLFFAGNSDAQTWKDWPVKDTVWSKGETGITVDRRDLADYRSMEFINPIDTNEAVVVNKYLSNGSLRALETYSDNRAYSKTGSIEIFYASDSAEEKGQIKHSYKVRNQTIQDTLRSWWPDGTLKRFEVHTNGELIKGLSFDENGEEVEHIPYFVYPDYPGGMGNLGVFLSKNIRYPKSLRKRKVEGKVSVSFIVKIDGSIYHLKILESPHPLFSEEVLRVMHLLPDWKPGALEGEPADVEYQLPVEFRLR